MSNNKKVEHKPNLNETAARALQWQKPKGLSMKEVINRAKLENKEKGK